MGLRRKTLLALLLITLILFGALTATSRSMILASFAEHERHHTLSNLDRAINSLQDRIGSLASVAYVWAAWNDTYAFMEDRDPEYIESNMVDGTFLGMDLNLIMLVDAGNALAYAKTFDLQSRAVLPDQEEIAEIILAADSLFGTEAGKSGLVLTPRGAMAVSSMPITDSEETLPANGFLVMGRFLDERIARRMSETLLMDVEFHRPDGTGPEDCAFTVQQMSISGNSSFVRITDGDTIAGYAMLDDVGGSPALVLKISMPRSAYKEGLGALEHFHLILISVMAILGFATIFIIEFLILRRLTGLTSQVNAIGMDAEHSSRVRVEGSDEISGLADNINTLLDIRAGSEAAQAELNEILGRKVRELETYKRLTVNRELRMAELKKDIVSLRTKGPEVVGPAD